MKSGYLTVTLPKVFCVIKGRKPGHGGGHFFMRQSDDYDKVFMIKSMWLQYNAKNV